VKKYITLASAVYQLLVDHHMLWLNDVFLKLTSTLAIHAVEREREAAMADMMWAPSMTPVNWSVQYVGFRRVRHYFQAETRETDVLTRRTECSDSDAIQMTPLVGKQGRRQEFLSMGLKLVRPGTTFSLRLRPAVP